jgi:fatty acid amide hydrolase
MPLLVLSVSHASSVRLAGSGGISVYELWKLTAELLEMRVKWSNEVIRSGVDAIVSPALPLPALPHGSSKDLTSSFSYMFVANMLLWPAGIVPVTTVRHDEQSYPIDDLPANQRDHLATLADKVMQNSAGCPLGVSIMTPAFQDEKCLRVMKEVERLVEFKEEPTAYKTGEPEHKYY